MTDSGSQDVNTYIAAAPMATQPMLRQLRALIKAAAPGAEERLSYRMPYYHYHGRLVYFAVHKNHIGLYPAGPPKALSAKEIKQYMAGTSTLRFRIGRPLPVALIRRLVKARVKENEAKVK